MKQELDELLCKKYPKMMVNRNKDMKETCMCWGFDCGDGWYDLIDELCANIQGYIDNNPSKNIPQVVAEQVKEKFGTLRFYTQGGDDLTSGMIWFAESMSGRICETCGNPGTRKGGGWIKTICKPCEDAREKEQEERLAKHKALTEKPKEHANAIEYKFIGEETGHHD